MKLFGIFKAFNKKEIKEVKYKEISYKCDACEYREKCNVIEITTSEDSTRHFVPNISTICMKYIELNKENNNG